MLSIGEFSKISGLTVKTLRFCHEKDLLVPTYVDQGSGYRYYSSDQTELAAAITQLRQLGFPLGEIADIVRNSDETGDVLDHLRRQRNRIEQQGRELQQMIAAIDQIIHNEQEARQAMTDSTFEIEEKVLDSTLIAAIPMTGKYSDCGKGFSKLGRHFGRYMSGKPFLLHHDNEYKEDDANFETCMPIRQAKEVDGIAVRELGGGKCVSLIHKGPYEDIGRAYKRVMEYIKDKDYEYSLPTREVYIKGPGMIFRGNPKKYLTEIQFLID